ncbi:GntR family transcriptional regulator [Rhodococcus phenolicus]|uniref:GntR family transcriptional regulator n=1 Tax=Rhodococcus phenolicus TaxID=263849 RepID=UPI00082B3754|nr:GntR family transcriptional regulator [Rhodococcus phenolicus]
MTSAESAADRAYAAIRGDILNGVHAPGTMLGEAGLAAGLGVSRTPIRAALVRLQEEGWITIYPKRGALVRGLTEKDISDLADARLVLEATSIARAPRAARDTLADRLDAGIAAQQGALAAADLDRFIELTIAFHRSFVEVSGNAVILEMYDRLADRHRFLLYSHGGTLLSRSAEIIAEHRTLIQLLRDDHRGFGEALASHLGDTHGADLRPLRP